MAGDQNQIVEVKPSEVYIVGDKSTSMLRKVGGTGPQKDLTRDQAVKEDLIRHLLFIQDKVDGDGVTVIFFGREIKIDRNVTADRADQEYTDYEPSGSTPLAQALTAALDDWERNGKPKGRILIRVYTDGAPDNKEAVTAFFKERVFKNGRDPYDPDDVFAVQFVKVGQDPDAAGFLEWLDDELKKKLKKDGTEFDYVDEKTLEEVYGMTPYDLYVQAFTD